MAELREEDWIFPRLKRLVDCLCQALEEAGGPALCYCGLANGDQPPLHLLDCSSKGCGVAWVRPESVVEVNSFPQAAEDTPSRCGGQLAVTVEVGVARCHPRYTRDGFDQQGVFEATRLYMADMQAMRRAITCCFRQGNPDYQVALGSWSPLRVSSGTSGGVWTATLG